MTTSEPLIRPPLQRRSQESLERVLTAGFEVLKEQGFDGFTLHEVSRRAGVSIGSIYSRVPSREALIMAIYERAMEWVGDQEDISRDGARYDLAARARIELLVTDVARAVLSHADSLRVFMRQAPLHPEIWDRAAVKSQLTGAAFVEALLERREDIRHPDPERAAEFAWRLTNNMTARWITHGSTFEWGEPMDDETMIGELARAVADYLLAG